MAEDFKPLLKPFAEESGEDPQTSNSEPPVLSPVPGFWGKAGAFFVDGVLLTFVFYIAANYAYAELYPHRMACQVAAIALVAVYFWIGSSHLTQGQTMGKFVFGYRVISLNSKDGAPPTPGQAALRALLVQTMILAYVFVRFPIYTTSPTNSFILIFTTLGCLSAAYAVSNAVFCGLHPKKLSFHDLLTRTAVVRSTEKDRAVEFLQKWDDISRTKLKLAGYPAISSAVCVLFLFGYTFNASQDQIAKRIDTLETIRGEMFVKGFHPQFLVGPSLENQKKFQDALKKGMEQLGGKSSDKENPSPSDTVNPKSTPPPQSEAEKEKLARKIKEFRKFGNDGRKFMFYFGCDDSLSTASLIADPRYQDLLAELPDIAETLSAKYYLDKEGKPLPYEAIQAEFSEILPLYLHIEVRPVHREVIILPNKNQALSSGAPTTATTTTH